MIQMFSDFTAKAEEFIAKANFGKLVVLEKTKNLTISLDAKKLSKDLIIVANNDNATVVLVVKHDFSVNFFVKEKIPEIIQVFQITTIGTLGIYAGLKGVKICEFHKIEKESRDCQWDLPVVTLVYQQGNEDGFQQANHLKLLSIKTDP